MKLTNPLYYPLAVLTGGLVLVLGVRFAQLPSAVMLPAAALIATGSAIALKSREAETISLDNPQLEGELQSVRVSARVLAEQANNLRSEAKKLLTDSLQIELLATVEYACDRACELPSNIDRLARQLQGGDAVFSVSDLQQQLQEVQAKLPSSSGVAKEQLDRLASSLERNIQLSLQGQDARFAQIVSLATLIQDAAGTLQKLQNKLKTADLNDLTQTGELQSLSAEFRSLQENVELITH